MASLAVAEPVMAETKEAEEAAVVVGVEEAMEGAGAAAMEKVAATAVAVDMMAAAGRAADAS